MHLKAPIFAILGKFPVKPAPIGLPTLSYQWLAPAHEYSYLASHLVIVTNYHYDYLATGEVCVLRVPIAAIALSFSFYCFCLD